MLKEKTKQLIVTFHTTAAAMAAERLCRERGISGRLLPVPRSLTSDCGIAWSMSPSDRERFETCAAAEGLELAGVTEMRI